MMENNKITVGKASYELATKEHTPENVIDYGREMRKDYEYNVYLAAQRGKEQFDGDFFIVVLRKRERLMENVFRGYFFPRKSCPTPTYDQIVYKYHRKEETIEFIWVVPDMETCTVFTAEQHRIAPEEMGLLKFVLDFNDGTLDKLAKVFNNEE
jgi:hypothetical protein